MSVLAFAALATVAANPGPRGDPPRPTDPEVAKRAEEVAGYIRGRVPAAQLEHRELDVVHTDDSKIAGKLTAAALRVYTYQFGEQRLKLTDVRSLGGSAPAAEDVANAPPAPPNLMGYANQFGKEFVFQVVGVQGQPVWGTDQYTLDSHVGSAAVHAGVVQVGQ